MIFKTNWDKKLLKAILRNDILSVKEALDHDADITTEDNYALRLAADNGYTEIVELLLDHGADATAEDNCALRWAASGGYARIVKLLLDHGADITAQDNYALRWAAGNGYIKTVKLLLDYDADVMARDNYALKSAVKNGHSNVAEMLIQYGADSSVLELEQKKIYAPSIIKKSGTVYTALNDYTVIKYEGVIEDIGVIRQMFNFQKGTVTEILNESLGTPCVFEMFRHNKDDIMAAHRWMREQGKNLPDPFTRVISDRRPPSREIRK